MTIHTFKDYIPQSSANVQSLFDAAIGENNPALSRRLYALGAVVCSAVNVVGYTVVIGSRLVSSVIYIEFKTLNADLRNDVKNVGNSLYFAAVVATYLFASCISSRFSFQPPAPLPDFPKMPPVEYSFTTEHQPVLHQEPKPGDIAVQRGYVSPDDPLTASQLRIGQLVPTKDLKPWQDVFSQTYHAKVVKHPEAPKDQLFRHDLDQLIAGYGENFPADCQKIRGESPAKKECIKLIEILTTPANFSDAAAQYTAFVLQLRKAIAETTDPKDVSYQFVHQLAYLRFAGVSVTDYATRVIEQVSGPLGDLTFDRFWTELERRNKAQEPTQLPPALSMDPWARTWHKAKGYINMWFDPLAERNVPYVNGTMTIGEREVKILRHGVPVTHNESVTAAAWRFVGMKPSASSQPQHTEDHLAYIREAARQNKNILHASFENGESKTVGDESSRVDLRLALDKEPNFFPLALRMDGTFFETLFKGNITEFKTAFKNELLGDFKKTGFSIPDKTKAGLDLDRVLNEVEMIYFPQVAGEEGFEVLHTFASLDQQQAYMLLCYAHLVTALCENLDISELEAHCKDDIDRGNAFKIIMELHLLFLTGKINDSASLNAVLIHGLIPPYIVKRQGIISKRLPFVRHVYEVMKKATSMENPAEGGYVAAKSGEQPLFPMGHTAKTPDEYTDFLKHLRQESSWPLPPHAENLFDTINQLNPIEMSINGTIPQQLQQKIQSSQFVELVTDRLRAVFENHALEKRVDLKKIQLTIEQDRLQMVCDVNIGDTRVQAELKMADLNTGSAEFSFRLI